MKKRTKALLVLFLSILFLVLGVASLLLPLVPGWILIGIGLLLFSIYSPRTRDWLESHTRRWPKLHARIERMRDWAERTIGTV